MISQLKYSVVILCTLMLILAGCGGKSAHDPTEIYYLVAANLKLPYWQAAAAGFKQAAAELGVKYEIVGAETYNPQDERAEFQRIVRGKQRPTGILVSSADPELLKGDIDAAIAAGIPVIAIDSDTPSSKRLMFIGTDNYKAGVMGAQQLVKQLNGRGTVAFFTIPGQANLADRLRGYRDTLAATPQIKIAQVLDMKGDPGTAFDLAKGLISEGSAKVDAFVCLEAVACTEVAEVLDRNQVKGKVVIAMDADQSTLEFIKKGLITATIGQKPFTMAYVGLKMLDDLYHHKLPRLDADFAQDPFARIPAFIDTGATLVTQANVASYPPLEQPPTAASK